MKASDVRCTDAVSRTKWYISDCKISFLSSFHLHFPFYFQPDFLILIGRCQGRHAPNLSPRMSFVVKLFDYGKRPLRARSTHPKDQKIRAHCGSRSRRFGIRSWSVGAEVRDSCCCWRQEKRRVRKAEVVTLDMVLTRGEQWVFGCWNPEKM